MHIAKGFQELRKGSLHANLICRQVISCDLASAVYIIAKLGGEGVMQQKIPRVCGAMLAMGTIMMMRGLQKAGIARKQRILCDRLFSLPSFLGVLPCFFCSLLFFPFSD